MAQELSPALLAQMTAQMMADKTVAYLEQDGWRRRQLRLTSVAGVEYLVLTAPDQPAPATDAPLEWITATFPLAALIGEAAGDTSIEFAAGYLDASESTPFISAPVVVAAADAVQIGFFFSAPAGAPTAVTPAAFALPCPASAPVLA